MENNVMREIRVVMGTWYVDFCIDSPATVPEMARSRESNLDLSCVNLPGNGARNPSCYLLSTCVGFPLKRKG